MIFEAEQLYHIYNQGNNRQKIFFTRENYLFFLQKIQTYILPYADILAWCLMPNHFHLMVLVKSPTISEGIAPSETLDIGKSETLDIGKSETLDNGKSETLDNKRKTLNHSIGIMLRSYTTAINKQNKTTPRPPTPYP